MNKIFPTHLNEFLQCRHIITLRKQGAEGESDISEELELLQNLGHRHEKAFLDSLEGNIVEIDSQAPPEEQQKMTLEAMRQGADYIYQGLMENGDLAGYSDFLEKVPEESALGNYSYEVIDTKLARRASAGNAVQLVHYAELVGHIQKKDCRHIHLVHGDNRRTTLKREDYIHYYRELISEYRRFLQRNEETTPFPVKFCSSCRYSSLCNNYLEENDDIAQIGYLNNSAITKLRAGGIDTLSALSEAKWQQQSGLSKSTFCELKEQARSRQQNNIILRSLPDLKRLAATTENAVYLTFFKHIQPVNGAFTFFAGLLTAQGRFEYLNIESSDDEKAAFQRITDFLMRYLDNFPQAVIYTFSRTDLTLIHDLSNRYNICHDDTDELIQKEKLMALLPLLRQSLYIPVNKSNLYSFLQVLDPYNANKENSHISPQILYDLYDSDRTEKNLENIIERGRLELNNLKSIAEKAAALKNEHFPVKVFEDSSL